MSIELSPGADGGIRTLTALRPRDFKSLRLPLASGKYPLVTAVRKRFALVSSLF
jgi:hypothetical protein